MAEGGARKGEMLMSRLPLSEEEHAKREAAWADSLCDAHAGRRCGCTKAAFTLWRVHQRDMPPNTGICPECEKENRRSA